MTSELVPRVPHNWYVLRCGRCGAPIRRHRQSTSAAWHMRHGVPDPQPFPITWHDYSGDSDCNSPTARRLRKERGERDINWGPDARHFPDKGLSKYPTNQEVQ